MTQTSQSKGSRVFITGSSDGLGLGAARLLVEQGHRVTLHARNHARANDAKRALPEAESVVIGDVSSIDEMRSVADQAKALGPYQAVIHNVGVGYDKPMPDLGRGKTLADAAEKAKTQDPNAEAMQGAFKTPTLRSITETAPYFHNGFADSLAAVVSFYDERFSIGLTEHEKGDLAAFLGSL